MLWYKCWLETRARFLAFLATLTIFCGLFVHHALSVVGPAAQGQLHPQWTLGFNRLLYVNQQSLVTMWILACVLLGMGGIVREKAIGISSLTLSLPVRRATLLGVRVGLGLAQAIVLGVVPWLAVFAVSAWAGAPISVAQVASYILLLIGGGLVYFAMAVLVSSLVSGEYTAPSLAFGVVLLAIIIFGNWLRRFDVWRLVTGDLSLDRNTFLLTRHLPWTGILVSLCVATVMVLVSVLAVEKREF